MKFIVYKITNNINKKMYIGFTSKTLDERWLRHLSDAKSNQKFYLHNAIMKYGSENFSKEIIEILLTEKAAKQAEKLWIKELNTFGSNGYNLTLGGDGIIGYKHTEEVKNKISYSLKGNTYSLGKIRSDESKLKYSISKIGHEVSMETRQKISVSKTGSIISEEIREKISKSNIGKKHTPEAKVKMSEKLKGKITTEETKNKISIANRMLSEQENEIINLYLNGLPIKKIQETSNFSVATIYKVLNRNNITRNRL